MTNIITVENLSKKYSIGRQQERYTALRDVLANGVKRAASRLFHPRTGRSDPRQEEFWALKDVNFEIRQGERVGIIGRNGAGKSTLLKVLSRITEPTSGKIRIKGRVASLLEVGTGFHPELTGRENIFLNGAILGMSKAEIRKKFDEIVAFAEVERFLDTPVKHYSSGMYVRLAFAVAAHLEPEILIVDEVLAVGDAQFQQKCIGKMQSVGQEGRTILFVSHQLGMINALCEKAILLKHGEVELAGHAPEVVQHYINSGAAGTGELIWKETSAPQSEVVRLCSLKTMCDGAPSSDVPLSKPISIELIFQNLRPNTTLTVSFHLLDQLGHCVLASGNLPSAMSNPEEATQRPLPAGKFRVCCEIPANFLNDQNYSLSVFVLSDVTRLEAHADQCLSFHVHDDGEMRKEYGGNWIGSIRPKLPWLTERIDQ